MTTILIKKKDTAGAPAPGDLTNAAGGTEIAVNTATKRVYTKDAGGTVVELGTNPSALTTNLLFSPDATYDIGASGASRPRDLFLSRNLTVGGTLVVTGGINFNGNVTVGDASTDTLTINSTITSNLIFTDNTYDIGALGANRPRNLYLSGIATIGNNATIGGTLGVTGTASFSGNVTLGDAAADNITVNGTVTSNLIFTDNTYDIGANGATRPRNLYLSNAIVAGAGATFGNSIGIIKSSGTAQIYATAGSSGTAQLTLTSGNVYGYTLQTDSGGTLDFYRDTTRYLVQNPTQENWFNSTYIYSSAGGSAGQVRSGIYLDGLNQVLNIFTGGNSRIAVNPFGNTFIAASNSITVASSSTYAFGLGNNSDGGVITFGSDANEAYIQTWGGKQLNLNNQGNKIRIGSNSQVGINTDGAGVANSSTASLTLNYHTSATASEHVLQLMYNNTMSAGNNVYMSFGQGTANQLARIAGVYEGGTYNGGLYFYTNRGTEGGSPSLSAKIDTAGRMLTPNQPGFIAIGAGYNGQYFTNQPIGNSQPSPGGFNVGGNFSYRASGGNARFTAPVSGYYFFTAGGLWYGGTGLTDPRTVSLQVNGSVCVNNYSDGGIVPYTPTVSAVIYLNANDYVQAYLTGTQSGWYGNGATAGNYDGSAYNFFSGYLIG